MSVVRLMGMWLCLAWLIGHAYADSSAKAMDEGAFRQAIQMGLDAWMKRHNLNGIREFVHKGGIASSEYWEDGQGFFAVVCLEDSQAIDKAYWMHICELRARNAALKHWLERIRNALDQNILESRLRIFQTLQNVTQDGYLDEFFAHVFDNFDLAALCPSLLAHLAEGGTVNDRQTFLFDRGGKLFVPKSSLNDSKMSQFGKEPKIHFFCVFVTLPKEVEEDLTKDPFNQDYQFVVKSLYEKGVRELSTLLSPARVHDNEWTSFEWSQIRGLYQLIYGLDSSYPGLVTFMNTPPAGFADAKVWRKMYQRAFQ